MLHPWKCVNSISVVPKWGFSSYSTITQGKCREPYTLKPRQTRGLYRFSAFWLRSKCSICSYQLNIWYGNHVFPSILNWFLQGDEVQELAPASSRVGLALQYRQDRPTSPLTPEDHQLIINLNISRSFLLDGEYCNSTKSSPFHCHHLSKNKLT